MAQIVVFGTGRGANVATRYFLSDTAHQVMAYTVDDEYATGEPFMGRPVIPFSRVEQELPPAECSMFISLGFQGMNGVRAEKYTAAKSKGYRLESYVSSRIAAPERPPFGENCFILDGNVFDFDVSVGNDVVCWSANHVGDQCVLEDHAWLSSHVVLSGQVTVGARAFLGVNSCVSNHVCIGARSYVGANCLIAKDTAEDSVHVAAPTPQMKGIDSLRFLQMIKS